MERLGTARDDGNGGLMGRGEQPGESVQHLGRDEGEIAGEDGGDRVARLSQTGDGGREGPLAGEEVLDESHPFGERHGRAAIPGDDDAIVGQAGEASEDMGEHGPALEWESGLGAAHAAPLAAGQDDQAQL